MNTNLLDLNNDILNIIEHYIILLSKDNNIIYHIIIYMKKYFP